MGVGLFFCFFLHPFCPNLRSHHSMWELLYAQILLWELHMRVTVPSTYTTGPKMVFPRRMPRWVTISNRQKHHFSLSCLCCDSCSFEFFKFILELHYLLWEVWITWAGCGYRNHRNNAAQSCQCVQHFCVSSQWYGCECLGFLICAQMLMHAIAHRGCTDTVRESALRADWEKNPWSHWGIEQPISIVSVFTVWCSTK